VAFGPVSYQRIRLATTCVASRGTATLEQIKKLPIDLIGLEAIIMTSELDNFPGGLEKSKCAPESVRDSSGQMADECAQCPYST